MAGGWQWSGIHPAGTSGLPFSLIEPGWTTDYQEGSYGVVTGKVKMRRHFDQNGNPQFFDDPNAINQGVATGTPIRLPYPGEAGERNNFSGDGYFDIDSGLSKNWKFGKLGALKFAWEVYNVTNNRALRSCLYRERADGRQPGYCQCTVDPAAPYAIQFAV